MAMATSNIKYKYYRCKI